MPTTAQSAKLGLDLVPDLVERQASLNPSAVALVEGRESLTYGELVARSRNLAAEIAERELGPDEGVAVLAKRSITSVVAALGIMRAGAAYLPLDPSHPEKRLAFQLQDARVKLVVADEGLSLPNGSDAELIALHQSKNKSEMRPLSKASPSPADAQALAYLIYTSGSTGVPKGVEISHGNLLNLVEWHLRQFSVTNHDRASHLAAVGFDAGVWEVWPYLCAGACLEIADEYVTRDPVTFFHWLIEKKITISFAPTILAEHLLDMNWPGDASLRYLLTGGDVLRKSPRRGFPFRVVNNYGPTECTVVATSGEVAGSIAGSGLPGIGKPISGVQVTLLDEHRQICAQGTPGEIWISGRGVARGYRNRPQETAERFQTIVQADGTHARAYRTGDIGRQKSDGGFEFLGRLDEQVKIRGFRVEPGEIEAILLEHPAIVACAVVAKTANEDDLKLACYAVKRQGAQLSELEVRVYLGERLPQHMVPSAIYFLEQLPFTKSGKVNRTALQSMNTALPLMVQVSTVVATETQAEVAAIVSALLQIPAVEHNDNFFLIGGHSLLGTQLIVRLRKRFGVEVSLRSLFDNPTVSEVAMEVERLARAKRRADAGVPKPAVSPQAMDMTSEGD